MKTAPACAWMVPFLLTATFVFATVPVASSHAETFEYETVIPNIISHPSLVIDAGGDAHLAYYLVTNSGDYGVAYAHRHQGAWTFELVDRNTVYDVALALDPAGNPHIAYYPSANARVQYASRVGGQWVIEPADEVSDVSGSLSLDFDGQGRAHIAYPWNGALKHGVRTGAGWASEVVDPALGTSNYPGVSLRVDVFGRPAVSYHAGPSLRFARQSSGAWTVVPIPSQGGHVETSLCVDAQGMASFAYLDNDGLRLARETAGGWTTELVDGAYAVGGSATLALDSSGNPHIGYYDAGNGAIKYAQRSGGAWSLGVVDGRQRSGQDAALALDRSGRPELAYTFRGYTGGLLRYATIPSVTAVGEPLPPSGLAMAPPLPNPASGGQSTLRFRLGSADQVSLALYDVAGHRVAARTAESFPAGEHRVRWDAGQRAPGLYFVRLTTGSGIEAEQRWVILR